METPPAAEFAAARDRHQQALEGWTPATVSIGGAAAVAAAVLIEEDTLLLDPNLGPTEVQRVTLSVRKTLVSGTPAVGTRLVVGGLAYKATSVMGHNAYDIAWRIEGARTPGADT